MSINESQNKFVSESVSSHKDEIYKQTQSAIKENIDQSVKAFTSQVLNTIDSSLKLLNNDYEKNIFKNKEAHDNCVKKLKEELKSSKKLNDNNNISLSNLKERLDLNIVKLRAEKLKNKMFVELRKHYIKSKTLKYESNIIVEGYFSKKRKLAIITNWKNITHANKKREVDTKYIQFFNSEQEKLEKKYNGDVSNLMNILRSLEQNIQKEIDERRYLSKLYDSEMNKGANKFLYETDQFKDFNSSDVQAP
jgi:hypothetical protein